MYGVNTDATLDFKESTPDVCDKKVYPLEFIESQYFELFLKKIIVMLCTTCCAEDQS